MKTHFNLSFSKIQSKQIVLNVYRIANNVQIQKAVKNVMMAMY